MNTLESSASVPASFPAGARVAVNFVAFQAGWWACVLGTAYDMPATGSLFAAVIVATHIALVSRPLQELRLVAIALLIGVVWDSLLLQSGWLDFSGGFLLPRTAPHWILALWALFAITLNHSLAWLHGRLPAAALLGAIAGPLAYWGGEKLGAVIFIEPLYASTALAAGWAMFTPLLIRLAQDHDDSRGAD
jgi:hypothetical protein